MTFTAAGVESDRLAWYRKAAPATYALLILLALVGAFIYKLRVDGIFACPASGYGANAYLSDCTARTYGDYDHGAFWFGLETQAEHAAANAEVLLIGNSRLQFAFSGDATARWFSSPRIRYYLLGFSHSETVAFLSPLLSKMRPRAKVYVINVDRLFDDRVSPPTELLLQGHGIAQRYGEKQSWQVVHRRLCETLTFVCGNSLAVYRERETGVWLRRGTAAFEIRNVSDGAPQNTERWDQYAMLGQRFLSQLPVDRSCVILTIVPTVETKRAEAATIAAKLGLELLSPRMDGLRTFDGSHLDESSAARWSAAFLREAGPRIHKCMDAWRTNAG
jgi:hypothetical protein